MPTPCSGHVEQAASLLERGDGENAAFLPHASRQAPSFLFEQAGSSTPGAESIADLERKSKVSTVLSSRPRPIREFRFVPVNSFAAHLSFPWRVR
jgi:hypothetical protein